MQLKTPEEKRLWLTAFPEDERSKAEEAARLLEDAQTILDEWSENDPGFIKAIIGFYPVEVENESLIVKRNEKANIIIPMLRQQEKRDDDVYKSLVDFVRPDGDFVGFFAATAGKTCHCYLSPNPSPQGEGSRLDPQSPESACHCGLDPQSPDDYSIMLQQLLRDRLAEATSEYLHEQVRKNEWGYSSNESYAPEELLKAHCRGIRPASGYPSLPDLSLNFILDELLDMKKIGILLTPNAAMDPNASVAGLYFSHPESDYFMVGKIREDQLADYAERKKTTVEETRKWVAG